MKKYVSTIVTGFLFITLFSGVMLIGKVEEQSRQNEIQERTTSILALLTKQVKEYTRDKINLLEKIKESWESERIPTEAALYETVKVTFSFWSGFKNIGLLNLKGNVLWQLGKGGSTTPPDQEKYLIDFAVTTKQLATGKPIGHEKEVVLYLALFPPQALKEPIILRAILNSGMLVQKIFGQIALKDYFVYFSDSEQVFYHNPPFSLAALNTLSPMKSEIAVGNRQWTLSIAPLSAKTFKGSLAFYTLAPFVFGFAIWIGYLFYTKRILHWRNKSLKQRVSGAMELIPQMFCELDGALKVKFANASFLKTFNLTEDHLLGGYDFTLLFTTEERFSTRKLLTQLTNTRQTHRAIFEMQKPNATTFPCEILFTPIQKEEGKFVGFYTLISDVSEKQKMEQQIKHLTHYDELTGLPNRTLFKELMSQEIARYARLRQPTALILIDIDRFKLVNDAVGHLGGDLLLKTVTERLMSYLRQGDTLARLGSDEFAFILSNSARKEQNFDITHSAQVVARKILTHLTKPFLFEGREIFMGGNIGIAFYPQDAEDTDTLIEAADAALTMSKVKGKNNYQFYFAEQNISAAVRLDAEKSLRYALKRHEFALRYLPKYDLSTQKICGVEALLAWKNPEKGVLLPEDFLHFAEENGLIVPIGKWVLKTACLQLQSWIKMHFNLSIAVNFSLRQIQEEHFLKDLLDILQETSTLPQLLELEIKEAILMSEKVDASKVLRSIQNVGVKLVLDDFGKGHSALGYLRGATINEVKIDAEFTRNIPQNLQNKSFVGGLIAFAHHLGLKVTAAGVETREEYEFLRQMGFDGAQGYYLSKPLRAEEVAELFRA